MGAPSAVASQIASLSLTGGKSYNLSDVTSKKAEQVYEELDYSSVTILPNEETYSATIERLANDKNFIQEIKEKILEMLEDLNFQHAQRVAGNIEIVSPFLIQILDVNPEFEKKYKSGDLESAIQNEIVDFALTEKDFLSKYEFNAENAIVIRKAIEEMVLDFYAGEDIYPTDVELEESSSDALEYGKSFAKKLFGKYFGFTFKEYSDDMLGPVLTCLRAKFPEFMAHYGDDLTSWTVSIIPAKLTDLLFGESVAFDDILETYGEDVANKMLGSTAAGISPYGSAVNSLLDVADDGFHMSSSLGSFTQTKYANMVDNLLSGEGRANAFFKKFFVPKDVTTPQQFYEKVIENTTRKATAVKAVKSGVASLVVSSIFSFGGGVVDAWNEGERDVLELAKAGAVSVLDDAPKILATAVGTAVGQVVGSVAGAAIGAAIGGPVGAFIGEKVGGFLGSLIGGWIGSAVGDALTPEEGSEKKWYKPWTW